MAFFTPRKCSGDGEVRVSDADTTPGFLSDKIVAGEGININTLNPGGDEELEISSASSWINQIPVGDVDGVNTTYTLKYAVVTGSSVLYINHQPILEGLDYTLVDPYTIVLDVPIDPDDYPPGFQFILKYQTYEGVTGNIQFSSAFSSAFN